MVYEEINYLFKYFIHSIVCIYTYNICLLCEYIVYIFEIYILLLFTISQVRITVRVTIHFSRDRPGSGSMLEKQHS